MKLNEEIIKNKRIDTKIYFIKVCPILKACPFS